MYLKNLNFIPIYTPTPYIENNRLKEGLLCTTHYTYNAYSVKPSGQPTKFFELCNFPTNKRTLYITSIYLTIYRSERELPFFSAFFRNRKLITIFVRTCGKDENLTHFDELQQYTKFER